MKDKAMEIYNGLPQYARAVVVIGGMLVGFLAVKGVINVVQKIKDAKKAKDRQKEFDADLANTPTKPSFSQSQYTSWASSIQSAFTGCDYTSVGGTIPIAGSIFYWSDSGSALWNIINELKNDADFLMLNKTFGIRTISKSFVCGGDYENYDLTAAVTSQLNQKERNGINELLKKKGIQYRF